MRTFGVHLGVSIHGMYSLHNPCDMVQQESSPQLRQRRKSPPPRSPLVKLTGQVYYSDMLHDLKNGALLTCS